jgi:hypothetical protein
MAFSARPQNDGLEMDGLEMDDLEMDGPPKDRLRHHSRGTAHSQHDHPIEKRAA